MASILKMNVFHWHLTEGLGWRVEIKKYPHLTQKGAFVGKGEEQQGFYSQEDIREIVQYATERCITVVPEIDMPGHAEAALSAYPELGCFGQPVEIPERGFTQNIFCAGKESTIKVLKDILDEVCDLFPSPYIHLVAMKLPKATGTLAMIANNALPICT
jgi:N-acetyl-beta-hexosaminidase